ncbi:MAG: TldD/PmbA family protein [Desulfurococcaceae archaeon]
MENILLDVSKTVVNEAVREGYDEAIVITRYNYNTMAKIFNSQLSVVQKWVDYSIELYLAKDKRVIILSLYPSDIESTARLTLKEMISRAKSIQESPFYAPIPEPKRVEPLTNIYDSRVLDAIEDPSKLVELAIEASHRERIDYVAGMINLWIRSKTLVSSKGAELYEEASGMQTYLRAFSEPDGSGQWSYCSVKLEPRGIEETALIAADYAIKSRGRTGLEPGRYDVILSPMVAGNLIELVASMSSAFSMLMGMSIFMKNSPGDIVASDKLTVLDKPRDVDLPEATAFDDESTPTFDKPIIEKGVLKTILHNSKTASLTGMETTGNAGWVNPHPWNIVVEPGDYTLDEMIREVKRGILVTNNWYTRLQNYVEGIFSTISRDALLYIENGEIKKPVEKVRIADKLPNLLRNIDGLTKNIYNIMWWEVSIPSKIPYILVRNVNITKHLL